MPDPLARLATMLAALAVFFATLGLAGLLAVDFCFQGPALAYLVGRFARHAGLALTYRRAEGSLLTGVFTFEDPELVAGNRLTGALAVKARFLRVDLAVLDFLGGTWRFQEVLGDGIEGIVRARAGFTIGPGVGPSLHPRTTVDLLGLSRVRLGLVPPGAGDEAAEPLVLESLVVTPLRSDLALLDLLAHGRVRGNLAGQPISVDSADAPEGRAFRAKWKGMPGDWWRQVGAGPLACASLGSVGLDLVGALSWGEPRQLVVRFGLDLGAAQIAVPGDLTPVQRQALAPILAGVRGLAGRPLWTVDLAVPEAAFRGADSYWEVLRTPLAEAAEARLAESAGTLDQAARGLRARGEALVRDFLDRLLATP